MPADTLITLTTDFGCCDTYVAQMKGVIVSIAPHTRIIDLCHDVPAHDIAAGALILDDAVDAFPPGTVHLAVVDPGVGGVRRPIAIRFSSFMFVGPDNGLATALLARYTPTQVIELNLAQYHAAPISDTFHGRDVFAPAAAYLAHGEPLLNLGEPIDHATQIELPQPICTDQQITAHIVRVDRFGNLITDLTKQAFDTWSHATIIMIHVGSTTIDQINRTFADVEPGQPVAYFGSCGRLEVAIRNGSAASELNISAGATVTISRA